MSTKHTPSPTATPEDTVGLLIASDPVGHNQWRNWIERGKVKDPEAEKILRQHFEEVESRWDTEAYSGIRKPTIEEIANDPTPSLEQRLMDAHVSQLRHKSGGIGFPLNSEEA